MFFQSEYNQPPLLLPPDDGRRGLVLIRLICCSDKIHVHVPQITDFICGKSFGPLPFSHQLSTEKSFPVIKSERRANLFIYFHTWISLRMCGDSSSFTAKKKIVWQKICHELFEVFYWLLFGKKSTADKQTIGCIWPSHIKIFCKLLL